MAEPTAKQSTPDLSHIVATMPDRISGRDGNYYSLLEADKHTLAVVNTWNDEELEQCHYIMSPLPDTDPTEEYKNLLKYLNMDDRVYTIFYGYMTLEMARRDRERNSLKRGSPTKRPWRSPEL